MQVTQALQARHSVRAFLPDAIDGATVRTLLEGAALAASGGNLQPWRVVALAGDALAATLDAMARAEPVDTPGASYPPSLWEPYRSRRFANGEDLYRSIGIPREDKAGRLAQLARNGAFFGAPVGIFVCVDERMGPAQWVDLGAYLQALMLLAVEHGLGTCAQGFWRRHDAALAAHLALPAPYRVAFGVALGREDGAAPINAMRSDRAPFAEWGELRGF